MVIVIYHVYWWNKTTGTGNVVYAAAHYHETVNKLFLQNTMFYYIILS